MPPEPALHKPRLSGLIGIALFALMLLFILGIDQIKQWGGRAYYERKLPKTLTEKSITEALGDPSKRCDTRPECMEFLNAFMFRKGVPQFSSYFTYAKHYPLLPMLVFFQDESGNIIGYDYGLN